MKTFRYVLVFLLAIQLALPYWVQSHLNIQDRMDYNLVKENISIIDDILAQVSQQIKQENLEDYIIILGDSVAFSGPGNSRQSIGHYMQELAQAASPSQPQRIFNLSLPAMQMGDIYTMLLKLDKYNISSQNLILDVAYQGFVPRNPDPSIVFWLEDDLQTLDRPSYEHVRANLDANQTHQESRLEADVNRLLWDRIALLRYRGFIKIYALQAVSYLIGAGPLDDSIGDTRAWYEKPGLSDLLKRAEYERDFSAQPFDLNPNNPQIYFLEKIITHQEGKHTLVFMAGANQELMHDKVTAPGYAGNLQKIDQYFESRPVQYINLYGQIDSRLYSDQIHLVAEGNRELAEILWDNFNKGR